MLILFCSNGKGQMHDKEPAKNYTPTKNFSSGHSISDFFHLCRRLCFGENQQPSMPKHTYNPIMAMFTFQLDNAKGAFTNYICI